ncbi:MAG: STAS domain-containing protein [Chlamydiia bacterium]|nr:STAS domain-containing protein [Chlamydiia bacterium]
MKVTEKKRGKVTLFSIEGRLDSNTSAEVDEQIMATIHEGSKKIVLDFSALEYISSAGVRVLVHCHKEVEKLGGHIYLASVPKPIENVLYITGFLPYFTVFDHPAQATQAIEQDEATD